MRMRAARSVIWGLLLFIVVACGGQSGGGSGDSTAPSLLISTPAAGSDISDSVTVTGSCETGLSVRLSASVTGSATATCSGGTFSASLSLSGALSWLTLTATQTDASGNVGTATRLVRYIPGYPNFYGFVARHATEVGRFAYVASTDTASGSTASALTTPASARGLDLDIASGGLVFGGNSTTLRTFSKAMASSGTVAISGGASAIADVHGLCTLPNGNYVAGGYRAGGVGDIYEYDRSSGAKVATVYTTTVNAVSWCRALSNTELLLIDYDGVGDVKGKLVKVTRSDVGQDWTAASNSFTANSAATMAANASIFTAVVHSNGKIYIFPQNLTNYRRVWSCNHDSTGITGCAAVAGSASNDVGAAGLYVQGATQIPGSDRILFHLTNAASTHTLRVYNPATDASADAASGANISALGNTQIRQLLLIGQ